MVVGFVVPHLSHNMQCLFVCLGTQVGDDPCAVSGDPTMLKPSFGAQRLEELVSKLLANSTFRQQQCVF